MIRRFCHAALIAGVAGLPALAQAEVQPAAEPCHNGTCVYRVTPQQLLAKAEQLVLARDFETARPLVAALAQAPGFDIQRHFLSGYIAVETGQTEAAVKEFRAALAEDPSQTRIRLELARALLIEGKESAADYHFRLAQQSEDLPEDIARTIRTARGVIRNRRTWHVNFDVGIAPDTNINNATSADAVDVRFGPGTILLQLDDNARARSGIGEIASVSGGVRLKLNYDIAMLIDADAQVTNYGGERFDDSWGQLAVGPEFRLDDHTTLAVQGVALQRWYGGQMATRQVGAKVGLQKDLDEGERIGLQLDARHSESGFSDAYDGWQLGAYATYERIIHHSLVASATVFVRRDYLEEDAYSSLDYGFNLGIGGELPMGINAGISGGLDRATYDAPLLLFSDDDRRDWRWNARAYIGLRSVKLWGFSPAATYTYGRIDTNYALYRNDRHRIRLSLARYF